jgi:hypothetical protein
MNKPRNEPTPTYRAVITGYGSFAPNKTLTNQDLAKMVDTTDEWITSRTGIKVRHITTDSETTAFLATEAAKKALRQAKLDTADLEIIISPQLQALYRGLSMPKRHGSLIYVPPAAALFIHSVSYSSSWRAADLIMPLSSERRL